MKINNLRLTNFRCFEQYEIDFSDRFTLLIGDNGSGKSALLRALSIATGHFFKLVDNKNLPSPNLSDTDTPCTLTQAGQNIVKNEPLYPILNFKLTIDTHNADLSISAVGFTSRQEDRQLVFDKFYGQGSLPLISYYGTERLWKIIEAGEVKTLKPNSRSMGYQDCLNPASNIDRVFRWFKTQELAALQKQERRHVLEAVREAIVNMIPDAHRAWWDVDWDEILIETVIQGKTQTIPFHLLSDGYRNMIGMVADIAYRMATLNPQLEADVIKQTEGIVLIDEIDLHLHPKWQREVVGRLLNTFPKVQFVASSHSPFIIQSLYGREDCLLWDLEKAQPLVIESKSIEDIAENQQGVDIPQQSQRFLDMEKAAEEYYRVLKQIPPASEDKKQRLKQRLDELLLPFSDDPAFQAFLKMERQAVEGINYS